MTCSMKVPSNHWFICSCSHISLHRYLTCYDIIYCFGLKVNGFLIFFSSYFSTFYFLIYNFKTLCIFSKTIFSFLYNKFRVEIFPTLSLFIKLILYLSFIFIIKLLYLYFYFSIASIIFFLYFWI